MMAPADRMLASAQGSIALRAGLGGMLLALPWLNPHAGGPSAAVEPWVFSALCACLFALVQTAWSFRPAMFGTFALLIAWALLRTGPTFDVMALGGALVLMLLVAGACTADEPQVARMIAHAWFWVGLVSTAMALAQYLGLVNGIEGWVSASPQGEAYANLRQRNQYATLTAISMAALIWQVRGPGAWAAVALLAAGNAATTSRTGLLELFALLALSALWGGASRPARLRLSLFALAAYGAAAVLLPLLRTALGHEAPMLWDRVSGVASCSARTTLWGNVLRLISERPWAGWGWGELDYAHFATLYPGERFCDILDNAHNLPLHMAVELGVPAAALLIAACGWAVFDGRPWAEERAERRMAWSVLVLVGIHSLLEYPLWYGPFQMAVGASMGLLGAPRAAGTVGHTRLMLARLLSLSLLIMLAGAAWDYRRVSQIYLAPEDRAPAFRDDTLGKVHEAWLFRPHALFAELTLAPLTPTNARWTFDESKALLHYSPEPRVIEKVIESATLLGDEKAARWHLQRYKAAFPADYARWRGTVGARLYTDQ